MPTTRRFRCCRRVAARRRRGGSGCISAITDDGGPATNRRPFSATAPIARENDRASTFQTFAGFLQADAYAGFDKLYAADRKPGLITPVGCWAHVRHKLNDVLAADARSIAREGLVLIGDLYEVERRITRDPHEDRRKARKYSKLKAIDFFKWADGVLAQVSARSPLAEALRYAVRLKQALLAYTEDGRLEIDNNLAENALRGITVGRKNWLFAGADCGGERAAAIYSLLETAKLNGINPQAWLVDVLDRVGRGHPINRTNELLPWNWTASAAASSETE